jgi:hypothetical protein
MRQINAKFPRLKDNLPQVEQGERKITLNLVVLSYNNQTANVGMNQIQNIIHTCWSILVQMQTTCWILFEDRLLIS